MDAGLTIGEQLKLGLTSTYYSVARALRLRKLRDLLQSAQIATDHAVWHEEVGWPASETC